MDLELPDFENIEPLEIALACSALFDQYDDPDYIDQADYCENLYPNMS